MPKKVETPIDFSEEEGKDRFLLDDNGEIQVDGNGQPIFKDSIEVPFSNAELIETWNAIKMCLEMYLAPPTEVDALFGAMGLLAQHQSPSGKDVVVRLPINYLNGIWRTVCEVVENAEFKAQDNKAKEKLKELALKLAGYLDMYHEVKMKEVVVEEASPEKVLKFPSLKSTLPTIK